TGSMANNQEREAQEAMFPAVYYLQSDSLQRAVEGDDNYPGFNEISEDYPLSKAANLSHFYTGVAYLKQGEYQKAIDKLKDFSSSDLLIQARAYSLIGDAYLELKKYEAAIDAYQQAADYKPNAFSPLAT
ncbi:MAG: tetratricopeptide repeat protein, partial [Bacteroidia bacterium]|nr:tetratricopeptide repeat protein [Bacteroidia bacterium]